MSTESGEGRGQRDPWTGRPRRWGTMTLLLVAAGGGWIAGVTLLMFAVGAFGAGPTSGPLVAASVACLAVAAVASVALARIFRH